LQVDAVFEGAVMRSGDRVWITAQLTRKLARRIDPYKLKMMVHSRISRSRNELGGATSE